MPCLRRGRFRKLSFNTERASGRPKARPMSQNLISHLGWAAAAAATLALDAPRSTDKVQSEREERQGVDFMSLQSDSETFFCRFLVVSEWSPDSTVGHATLAFFYDFGRPRQEQSPSSNNRPYAKCTRKKGNLSHFLSWWR